MTDPTQDQQRPPMPIPIAQLNGPQGGPVAIPMRPDAGPAAVASPDAGMPQKVPVAATPVPNRVAQRLEAEYVARFQHNPNDPMLQHIAAAHQQAELSPPPQQPMAIDPAATTKAAPQHGFWRNFGVDLLQNIGAQFAPGAERGMEAREAEGAREKESAAKLEQSKVAEERMEEAQRQRDELWQAQIGDYKSKEQDRLAKQGQANEKNKSELAKVGLMQDESGNIVAVPEDQLPPALKIRQQQIHQLDELHSAQADLASAKADLARAQNDPTSPAYKLAQQKANTAQSNVMRAQAQLMNAYANIYGTSPSGEPIPGIGTTEQGTPIGYKTQTAFGPTSQMRTRGQIAGDILEAVPELKATVEEADKAGYLGPAAGRWQDVLQKVGENTQLGSELLTYLTLMSHATAIMHFGGKATGEQLHDELNNLLNQKANKESLYGSLNAISKWAKIYKKTGGANYTQPKEPEVNNPPSGGASASPADWLARHRAGKR